ncbi:MAG: CHAT domain-containing protein [Vicinamibacterales bacterium]
MRDWAIKLAEKDLPPLSLARVRRDQATQRAAEGRFNEALADLHDVRITFAEAGDVVQAAQTALDQAGLLEWLGDNDRALDCIASARNLVVQKLTRQPPSPARTSATLERELQSILTGAGPTGESDEASSLWRISLELVEHEARVRKARGEYDTAAKLFNSVLDDYESTGAGAAVEYQLVSIDVARGRPAQARQRLTRIVSAFGHGLMSGKVAGLRLLQAYVALGVKEFAGALAFADSGIIELETHPDDDLAWRLHWRRAQALRALYRVNEALVSFETATGFVDLLRRSPLGYRLDSTALRAKLPLFEEAIEFAAECQDADRCLHFIELVKSRALSTILSIPATARVGRSDLEAEFDRVTQRLDALEYQSFSGVGSCAAVQKERGTLVSRRIALMEQMRLRDPRWRGITAPPPFDSEKLAAVLKHRNQTALTLHLHHDVVRSVLVFNGKFEIGQRTLNPNTVEILGEYAANLIRPRPDPYMIDPADLRLDASMFVPPELLGRALSSSSLLIAPHGNLHLLPWSSLPFGNTRLFERTAVGVLPNLTCALMLYREGAALPRAAFAGVSRYSGLSQLDDLLFTKVELNNLVALYAGRLVAPALIDDEATESAVRALATRNDATSAIMHLSCHGTLSVEEPLSSGVLVTDGKIDAAEWAGMHLFYDEVVLSACSTGWRPLTAQGVSLHGDDVLGLPGALLEAGARSILVSIPKAVDEATAAFMTMYHTRRAAGVSPLAAFRETQCNLLTSHHKPYTWCGFVCYGVS